MRIGQSLPLRSWDEVEEKAGYKPASMVEWDDLLWRRVGCRRASPVRWRCNASSEMSSSSGRQGEKLRESGSWSVNWRRKITAFSQEEGGSKGQGCGLWIDLGWLLFYSQGLGKEPPQQEQLTFKSKTLFFFLSAKKAKTITDLLKKEKIKN